MGNRWHIEGHNDWSQLRYWREWNWVEIQLGLMFTPEYDPLLGRASLKAGLLGFWFNLSYTYDDATDFRKQLKASADECISKSTVMVPHDKYVAMKADADKWRGVPTESLGREAAP